MFTEPVTTPLPLAAVVRRTRGRQQPGLPGRPALPRR
ncbi:hypothetical protein FHS40_000407 [Streptomyces spectabilis]|uniref:Uncharacterized protein n=1 Tax=Streptomyces spectabilis TaxID=68270 RepID=A0A7W8ES65_STRST|nr:hypothetical protein [Streptomyces spectabilis]